MYTAIQSRRGFGAVEISTSPTDGISVTSSGSPWENDINALISQGYGDSSTQVDTSTGLPLYVKSPSNPNPTPIPCGQGINPTPCPTPINPVWLIGGALGLVVVIAALGRRR